MNCNIELRFKAGSYKKQTMMLSIVNDNNTIFKETNVPEGNFELNFGLNIPCKLAFIASGRNTFDTLVDTNGNIIEHKFIELVGFQLDNLWVPGYKISKEYLYYIDKNNVQKPDNNIFWNNNGTIILNIDQSDPILWWLSHPELFN